jgi:hypothetical protein
VSATRTFDPWIGNHYATGAFGGKRLLVLGESHYGDEGDLYPGFTAKIIREYALQKGYFRIFPKIQRLVVGGPGGFSNAERAEFWHKVAFYNFIQTILDYGGRPTYEMWQAAREPFLQTVRELAPNIILVLGMELNRNLQQVPDGIIVCPVKHPSAKGFSYDDWQPKVRSVISPHMPRCS